MLRTKMTASPLASSALPSWNDGNGNAKLFSCTINSSPSPEEMENGWHAPILDQLLELLGIRLLFHRFHGDWKRKAAYSCAEFYSSWRRRSQNLPEEGLVFRCDPCNNCNFYRHSYVKGTLSDYSSTMEVSDPFHQVRWVDLLLVSSVLRRALFQRKKCLFQVYGFVATGKRCHSSLPSQFGSVSAKVLLLRNLHCHVFWSNQDLSTYGSHFHSNNILILLGFFSSSKETGKEFARVTVLSFWFSFKASLGVHFDVRTRDIFVLYFVSSC